MAPMGAQAKRHFEAACEEEGDSQASAFEWLGHWYREVDDNPLQAAANFRRALELEPDNQIAGLLLSVLCCERLCFAQLCFKLRP